MSQPNIRLGLVSNCWQTQLARGELLSDLIAEAAGHGFGAVELRQGSLGEYESGDPRLPHQAAFLSLAHRFPQMRLSLAVELPYLTGTIDPDHFVFSTARQAAQALCGRHPPQLRLVDLTTEASAPSAEAIDDVGSRLAELARSLADIGGSLSIENARQPWGTFQAVFQSARRQLGVDRLPLKLCYDPVNLLLAGDAIEPAAVTSSLMPNEIAMVHFKQRCDGRIASAVCDGDVDWRAQLDALRTIGYGGPFLFEVASHKKLWGYLAGSQEYLRRRGLEVGEE